MPVELCCRDGSGSRSILRLISSSLLEQEAEFDLGGDFIPSFEELAELTWDALAPAIARSPTES